MDILIVISIIFMIFVLISFLNRGDQRSVGGRQRKPTLKVPQFNKKKKKPLTDAKSDAKRRLDSI